MEKIFYAERSAYPSSERAIEKILRDVFGAENAVIARTETGKPYLADHLGLFFSVAHTDELLFVAFSDTEVGIDAERLDRAVDYLSIVKKFPVAEREEISSARQFLERWVVKESAVKYLGSTLAKELKTLCFSQGKLLRKGAEMPVALTVKTFRGHIVAVCGKRDFENAEFIGIGTL
ncbi:MAG: 4'-phosphopantetheinyl transferase superfamily protein [Clostridia bacterium]|nr:4'-phosphopantetheinyl transferase superfamily protein [Clostridia bacterium]